jgi:hypothetical protein
MIEERPRQGKPAEPFPTNNMAGGLAEFAELLQHFKETTQRMQARIEKALRQGAEAEEGAPPQCSDALEDSESAAEMAQADDCLEERPHAGEAPADPEGAAMPESRARKGS